MNMVNQGRQTTHIYIIYGKLTGKNYAMHTGYRINEPDVWP